MTNSQVCVDANLIVWSLIPFPLSDAAEALLATWQKTGTTLIAPSLLAYNAVHAKVPEVKWIGNSA
jgi:hypothetical protein